MGQNLKKLFEKDRLVEHKRRSDHEDLFTEKLYKELPVNKRASFSVLKIAASIVVIMGLGILSYNLTNSTNQNSDLISSEFTLSNISPELKEIENFYVTNINLELSNIEKKRKNQAFVKRHLSRHSVLKEAYKHLITEMNQEGPNSQSISVLINNLRLQLELLQELRM